MTYLSHGAGGRVAADRSQALLWCGLFLLGWYGRHVGILGLHSHIYNVKLVIMSLRGICSSSG